MIQDCAPSVPIPREPPMMLVHKGWFVSAERPVRRSVLARYRPLKHRLRSRPFWRGLSARWQRVPRW